MNGDEGDERRLFLAAAAGIAVHRYPGEGFDAPVLRE
jgi:hypothetical protein